MSGTTPVQPMSARIWWGDLTTNYYPNIFQSFASVPKKPVLVILTKYLDSNGAETAYGHILMGYDNYYFNSQGNPPTIIEYGYWNNPTTGQTRTNIYELRGLGIETVKTGSPIRVNTLSASRIWTGALVSDTDWNNTIAQVEQYL